MNINGVIEYNVLSPESVDCYEEMVSSIQKTYYFFQSRFCGFFYIFDLFNLSSISVK